MKVYTIGFTKKSAKDFFDKLNSVDVRRVLDVRLKNTSHLAGFAKRDDLRYFLRELHRIDYIHCLELAPTEPMLDDFKKRGGSWAAYKERFLGLMRQRRVGETFPRHLLDHACLLCSEPTPDHCHRRLVCEYLREQWGNVEVTHLV